MRLTLEDGETKKMWFDSTHQHIVSVEEEMMCGERSSNPFTTGFDELNALLGGDVLKDDLQLGEALNDRCKVTFNEDGFPIKNIDFGIGDLAMDQKGNPCFLHRIKQRVKGIELLDPRIRISCRTGRVEFESVHKGRLCSGSDFLHRCRIGEIERHQRLKLAIRFQRQENAIPVGEGGFDCRDRWTKVRHDDGATEVSRRIIHDIPKENTISKVKMPIIGLGDRKRLHSGTIGCDCLVSLSRHERLELFGVVGLYSDDPGLVGCCIQHLRLGMKG